VSFRTRIFLVSIIAAALTLGVATLLMSWSVRQSLSDQIERGLANQALLAAETLSDRPFAGVPDLDAEAEAIGRLISTRITFIAPDGRVVGDSDRVLDDLPTIENHGERPEILQARAAGVGRSRRFSTTVNMEMTYVAVRVDNPTAPELAFVRLALPLTAVHEELSQVRRLALVAFGVALLAAFALAGLTSALLGRRVTAIARVAERYAAGDLSRPARDYGSDEIGTVARVLDANVQELGRRVSELDADRARMSAILRGMIEGVLVVNDQGRLELVNDAARRMLKLQDAPEGRHYLEIVRHPGVAEQLGVALRGASAEGQELSLPMEPGAVFVARSAPVEAGTRRGAVLVLHDITDLRRADQVRRDFVANISHELRTPLTAVKGYVEALLDGGIDQETAPRFLETIARQTSRMERLVTDLLRLARLDAGQEPLERIPCQLASLFDTVAADLASLAEQRRQQIVRTIGQEAGTVVGDPAKLFDVLRNLLENAIKHTPEGGTIHVHSRRDEDRILLVVEDEGTGIPEGDLPRVFERFYQVDKARTRSSRDAGGTGLGLSIVKHLVELHGGSVAAANRAAGGARFTVALPAPQSLT
jgi:two-component system, OmpR family, phosphate regulon sensor histidine kinase PhoR